MRGWIGFCFLTAMTACGIPDAAAQGCGAEMSPGATPSGGPAGVATPTPIPSPGGDATPPAAPRGGATPALGGATGGRTVPAPAGTTGGGSAMAAPKKAAGGAGRWVPRGGTTPRSPHVCDLVTIAWIDAAWPISAAEGYGAAPLPLGSLIARRCIDPSCVNQKCKHARPKDPTEVKGRLPAMIYLYDPKESREAKRKRELETFGADDLAGLFAFVSPFSMAADPVERAEYEKAFGKTLPALIFLSPRGRTVGVLEGRFSAADVKKMIEKTISTAYGIDGKVHAAKYQDILKTIEKAEDEFANAQRREQEVREQTGKAESEAARAHIAEAAQKKTAALEAYRRAEAERVRLLTPAPAEGAAFEPKREAAAGR